MKYATSYARCICVTVTVGGVLLAPQGAFAADRYISPRGVDANPCTLALPCRSWTRADDLIDRPGDTLYARGGVYTGQAGVWDGVSGTAAQPVTFRNYPGETPVFDGQGIDESFLDLEGGPDHTVVQGLTVRNYKGTAGIWIGYAGQGTDYAVGNVIRGMTFRDIGDDPWLEHAIYPSYGNRDLTIEDNRILNTSGAAIHGWHGPGVQHGVVRRNLIVGATWGVIFGDGARNVLIENNTVVDVDWECIRIEESGEGETGDEGNYGSVVRRNLIVRCLGIGDEGATNPVISGNHFHMSVKKGDDSTAGDPLFGVDYSLRPGSPAAGTGADPCPPA